MKMTFQDGMELEGTVEEMSEFLKSFSDEEVEADAEEKEGRPELFYPGQTVYADVDILGFKIDKPLDLTVEDVGEKLLGVSDSDGHYHVIYREDVIFHT